MNWVWLLFYLLTAVNFGLLLFTVITAGLHTIKQAKLDRSLAEYKAYQPEVTILVPAHNERLVIERCLRSLEQLNYPNYSVIVINDGSKDETSQLAHNFLASSKLQGQVIDVYPNKGKGGALNYVLHTQPVAELFMVLDADCTIAPDGLQHMVNQFLDPRVKAVSSNVRIHEEPSLLAYFQQIEYIVGYFHKRHNHYTNSEFIVGGQGATYRRDAVMAVGGIKSTMQTEDIDLSMRIAARGNKHNRIGYSANTLVYTEAVPTVKALYKQRYRWKFGAQQAIVANRQLVLRRGQEFTKLLTWFRLPQSVFGELRLLFDVALLLLFVGIAMVTQSLFIFFGAWFTVTIYSMFVVLADQHASAWLKTKLCVLNLLLFPFHLGMTLLNFVAAIQMLRNWQQLIGRQAASGAWEPPTRIGKQLIG